MQYHLKLSYIGAFLCLFAKDITFLASISTSFHPIIAELLEKLMLFEGKYVPLQPLTHDEPP